MSTLKNAVIMAALGAALFPSPLSDRIPQNGHLPSKLKTGNRAVLRAKKARARKAKKRSR